MHQHQCGLQIGRVPASLLSYLQHNIHNYNDHSTPVANAESGVYTDTGIFMVTSIDLSTISGSFVAPFLQLNNDAGEAGEYLTLPEVCTPTMHGRSEEVATLHNAYQFLLRAGKRQIVIVHGKSGSGKTALVDTLRSPVVDTAPRYFVSGKYFQNEAAQEPFSAIMAAFSDLCDLVVQSDDFDETKKRLIANALHGHSRLLVKAVTNLAALTGPIDEAEHGEVLSTIKFRIACKAFLYTLASYDHPLVVFLDDIQWADEGSTSLIQMLLRDSDLANVMLILAYRDEESEVAEAIVHNARDPVDIALSDLNADAVRRIVTSRMGSATKEIELLSDLVVQRTSGNPFHIATFLDIIENEGLLVYDIVTKSWLFDVDEIQQTIMVSETLADLLTRKVERVSYDVRESLKVAALLGYQFDKSILESVLCAVQAGKQSAIEDQTPMRPDSSPAHIRSVIASLAEAVKVGFVEEFSGGYQFTHDKLQSAFHSLVDTSEEKELNRLIGEVFLQESAQDQSYIYKAAVHLNIASVLPDCQDRACLAHINLGAAKYCIEVSDFGRAITVLEHGLNYLSSEERWTDEYSPLVLEIMEALAKNQFIVGKFEDCKNTVEEALRHSMPTGMKLEFQLIGVKASIATNDGEDTPRRANLALTTLGIKMPRKVTMRHVISKTLKIKWFLRKKTDDDILNLRRAQDPLVIHSVKLLVTVCWHYVLRQNVPLGLFSALMAVELTLKNGLALFSPGAFSFYSIMELHLGNLTRGYRFGKLAMAMLDGMESREAEHVTVGTVLTTLTFRKECLRELIEPLRLSGDSGLASGNIGYAALCLVQAYGINIHLGTNLTALVGSLRQSYNDFAVLDQDGILAWLQLIIQYVLNMQADVVNWENISILSGEMMEEQEFLDDISENDSFLFLLTYLRKARIACDFGQFELAESYFDTLTTKTRGKDPMRLTNEIPPYYWDMARTQLSLYEVSRQRRCLRQGRRYMKRLQQMTNDGCPDAGVRLVFLEAQKVAVTKRSLDDSSLRATYRYAIDFLAKSDYYVLEGLLSEHAGFNFVMRGLHAEAMAYFDRALHIYEHTWGARAKYNQLRQNMCIWMEPNDATTRPPEVVNLTGLCINVESNQ